MGARIKEAIGTESVRSFSKRCSISDSLLGAYIRGEKAAGSENLSSIAEAANVTIDWLATGKGLKTRTQQRAAQGQAQYQISAEVAPVPRIELALLRQCLGACNIVYGAPFAAAAVARQLEHAVELYNALLPNIGPRLSLEELAARDAASIAVMLQGLIAVRVVRPYP